MDHSQPSVSPDEVGGGTWLLLLECRPQVASPPVERRVEKEEKGTPPLPAQRQQARPRLIPTKPPTYRTVEFEGFVASNFEGYVTKFAPHKSLKLIT